MTALCKACGTANRNLAKYCKQCGAELGSFTDSSSLHDMSALVGLAELKSEISKKIKVAKYGGERPNLNTVIVGRSGTGKSVIATMLAEVYFKNKITSIQKLDTITSVEFNGMNVKDLTARLSSAKGGCVLLKDVHKLLPESYKSGMSTSLDKLWAAMDVTRHDPVIILTGSPTDLRSFVEQEPEIGKRFDLVFRLPDLTASEMAELAERAAKRRGWILPPAVAERMKARFRWLQRKRDSSALNGHLVDKEIEKTIQWHTNSADADLKKKELREIDIQGEIYKEMTMQEILDQMDRRFVGMATVKSYIRNKFNLMEQLKKDAALSGAPTRLTGSQHMIITGNPGTGKTVVARTLGDVFASLGMLDSGHVVEVDRSNLVADHVGGSAKAVQKYCDDALGGVLFIDEVYNLRLDDQDTFGKEATDTLMKRMEDDTGKFIVIVAGYRGKMDTFMRGSNEGLPSRFNLNDNAVHIEDYSAAELSEIFRKMADEKKCTIDSAANDAILDMMTREIERKDLGFANGRAARNLFDSCVSRRAARMATGDGNPCMVVTDVAPPQRDDMMDRKVALLKELDELVGLRDVKSEVSALIDFLDIEAERAVLGGKKVPLNMHFIFAGGPGTGKTTVARILAQLLGALGFLSKGHLVEVNRDGLVGQHQGDTEKKTADVINQAMGGVLFIDEAYTLVADAMDTYGRVAINTLVPRLTNDGGKFIAIAAGYSREMNAFLAANAGLSSRFNRQLLFADYNADELKQILNGMLKKLGLVLDAQAEVAATALLSRIYDSRDDHFGNARAVENIVKEIRPRQSSRLATAKRNGVDIRNALNTITASDLPNL